MFPFSTYRHFVCLDESNVRHRRSFVLGYDTASLSLTFETSGTDYSVT